MKSSVKSVKMVIVLVKNIQWSLFYVNRGVACRLCDGSHVRNWEEKQRHFEIRVGRHLLAFAPDDDHSGPSSKCFGFMQSYNTRPTRRLFEALAAQRMQMDQQMTFRCDDGDTVRISSSISAPRQSISQPRTGCRVHKRWFPDI